MIVWFRSVEIIFFIIILRNNNIKIISMSTSSSSFFNSVIPDGLVGYLDPADSKSYIPDVNMLNSDVDNSISVRSSGYTTSSPAYPSPQLRRSLVNIVDGNEFAEIVGDNYVYDDGSIRINNPDIASQKPSCLLFHSRIMSGNLNVISFWIKTSKVQKSQNLTYLHSKGQMLVSSNIPDLWDKVYVYENGRKINGNSDVGDILSAKTGEWRNLTFDFTKFSSGFNITFATELFLFAKDDIFGPSEFISCNFGPVLIYNKPLSENQILSNFLSFQSRFAITVFPTSIVPSKEEKILGFNKRRFLTVYLPAFSVVIALFIFIPVWYFFNNRKKRIEKNMK